MANVQGAWILTTRPSDAAIPPPASPKTHLCTLHTVLFITKVCTSILSWLYFIKVLFVNVRSRVKTNLETPYISLTKNTIVLTGCGSWAAAGSAIFTAPYPPIPTTTTPLSYSSSPLPFLFALALISRHRRWCTFSKPAYYLA